MQRLGPSVETTLERTTYLVLDELENRRIFRETDAAEADRETAIQDIVTGQYKKAVCVIAFNTAEGWARDVTHDVARGIVDTTEPLSDSARDFVERVSGLLTGGLERGLTRSPNRTETLVPLFKWF